MIKIYTEPMPENVSTIRYQEVIMMDAIDSNGDTVQVIDSRRSRIVTESQIDSELEAAKLKVIELQAKIDEITNLK